MYCSRCGKKVLDSMLFCPFCGAEIIIPEQDSAGDEQVTAPEPVKEDQSFSFYDILKEMEKAPEPEPESAEPKQAESALDMRFPWEEPEPEAEKESEPEPETTVSAVSEPPVQEKEAPKPQSSAKETEVQNPDRRPADNSNVVPGRRTDSTLVPDKASMFMDDADDFDKASVFDESDAYDDTDEYDDFEDEIEREVRGGRKARGKGRRLRDDDMDDDDDDDGEDRSFVARHIRGIVGILLFLVLLAVLAFYALSDAGQTSLAKINATLPLRPEIYSKIAYEYYQSGEFSQSGLYYERALARDAGSYNYASSAAMAYLSAGNNDKAAEMLKKCIQLNPDAVEPYVYLLNLYPSANSRPWDIAQLLRQGYERTGDARLEAAENGTVQG